MVTLFVKLFYNLVTKGKYTIVLLKIKFKKYGGIFNFNHCLVTNQRLNKPLKNKK